MSPVSAPDTVPPRPEDARAHALAAVAGCLGDYRSGRYAHVIDEAPAVLDELAALSLDAERRELLYAQALSACEAGRFDIALEAAQTLGAAVMPLAEAGPTLRAAFVLGACLERMGDSWQAERVLSEALAAAGPAAPARERMIALNGLCAFAIGVFHRVRGVEDETQVRAALERARAYATGARALLAAAPEGPYEVTIGGNLGEVLTHLGELDDAWALLEQARNTAAALGMQAHGWRIECTVGEWLLAAGRPDDARDAMARLLARMGDEAPPQTVIRAHQAAYRACRALGRFDDALTHFERAEQLERRRVTAQLRAQSQLFVTRSEAERARRDAQLQRRRANEYAEHAERDVLTGLGNRRLLQRRVAELLPAAERDARPLALAVLDVDHFKSINDRFGHPVGDAVLVELAQLLRENTRAGDVIARFGGEEFVVVLPGMAMERAGEVCERLRERVAAHRWDGVDGPVTVSIGLAVAPPYDAQELMRKGDAALYRAKRSGRNRVCRG